MEQLGYLDDPADRLGMLDGQRMRAARVVLDIGVHLEKPLPRRQRTVGPATTRSGSCAHNVNMNDELRAVRGQPLPRLARPGAVLQGRPAHLGAAAGRIQRREGAAFDIKAFHKKALDIGGVGLDTLRSALLD